MKTVSAQFDGSSRHYTYLTELDLEVGDRCLTKTPRGYSCVTISAVPAKVPVDPNAQFDYKELSRFVHVVLVRNTEGHNIAIASVIGEDHVAKGPTADIAISNLLKLVSHEEAKANHSLV